MKKVFLLFVIIAVFVSCSTPKFIVVEKQPTGVLDNCVVTSIPINKRGEDFSQVIISKDNKGKIINKFFMRDILVSCNDYNLGDTLILDRKHFTNRKLKSCDRFINPSW